MENASAIIQDESNSVGGESDQEAGMIKRPLRDFSSQEAPSAVLDRVSHSFEDMRSCPERLSHVDMRSF